VGRVVFNYVSSSFMPYLNLEFLHSGLQNCVQVDEGLQPQLPPELVMVIILQTWLYRHSCLHRISPELVMLINLQTWMYNYSYLHRISSELVMVISLGTWLYVPRYLHRILSDLVNVVVPFGFDDNMNLQAQHDHGYHLQAPRLRRRRTTNRNK
jgi:hypothetical protein